MISFLITHYNRPNSLVQCISSIRSINISLPYEIVVSDDCSLIEHQQKIMELEIDKIVKSEINTGLSGNINRGLIACTGDYVVYIQEDFKLLNEFEKNLEIILDFIDSDGADMIRLSSIVDFKDFALKGRFFKMIPRFSWSNFIIDHFRYSDHPFLVKKSFFEQYGNYKEGVNTIYGENEYMVRMMSLNPKIAICAKPCAKLFNLEGSVREENPNAKSGRLIDQPKLRKLKRFIRSLRFKLEFLLYNPKKRKLYTFKNLRG